MQIEFQLDIPFLFKYCDPRGIDILESTRLKVTPPNDFNDPFEFTPKVEPQFSRLSVTRALSSSKLLKEIWKELSPELDFDSFRELYTRELHRRGAPHIRNTLRGLQRRVTKTRDGVLAFMSERFGIACYSEVNDDILMWAHYTRSHRGFVVGFHTKHSFFRNGKNLVPVVLPL